MRFLGHSVLYSDRAFHAAFPAVCALADGSVLLLFRRARDVRFILPDEAPANLKVIDHLDCRSHIAALRLNQDMRPQGEVAMLPMDAESVDQDASIFVRPDGSLILASFSYYPFPADMLPGLEGLPHTTNPRNTDQAYLFWGGYTRIATSDARAWGDRRYLPPLPNLAPILPERRQLLGGAIRGTMAQGADGTLYLASYFSSSAVSQDNGCYLIASNDNGDSWSIRGEITRPDGGRAIGIAEPSLVMTQSNRLIAFFRTFDMDDRIISAELDPINGAALTFRVHEARGHPCNLMRLADGRIVMTYGYRSIPYGVRQRILDSEAEAVDAVPETVIVNNALSADCGYPWSTLLHDGTLLIVYYTANSLGTREIHGVRYAI